ncbi:MAG: glycosyltransferase family 4 protein [Planctomycetaceae bacterium]|nr:glycosyltransferase family 4 protein [Planctomycetaceae bacterium]
MRLAFLTPEFPDCDSSRGGLGNFVYRVARVSAKLGHDVSVFTGATDAVGPGKTTEHFSRDSSASCDEGTITIFRLPIKETTTPRSAIALRLRHNHFHLEPSSQSISNAVVSEDRANRFDVIHASDYGFPSLYLPAEQLSRVVIRSSSPTELYRRLNIGFLGALIPGVSRLEATVFHAANRRYAPSRFTAEYFEKRLKLEFEVIRPPFFLEHSPDRPSPSVFPNSSIPTRFLLHVGNFNRVKGTDLIGNAMRRIAKRCPEMTVVFAGPHPPPTIRSHFGRDNAHSVWLGPLNKPAVYWLMQNAVATLAPSRADNFPNVVLESLACGTPVIGSDGASINEMIVNQHSGLLIPIGDVDALAQAMLYAWAGHSPFDGMQPLPEAKAVSETEPHGAATRLIEWATS